MNIIELKEKLHYFSRKDIGIIVYFIIKKDSEMIIKQADIENEHALPDLKEYFTNSINSRIIENCDLSLLKISQTDERKNVIYEYDLDELPQELFTMTEVLKINEQPVFNFNEDSLDEIKGYIILIGNAENKLVLYKQHYGFYLIKRDGFLFHKAKERFVRFNEDLIRFDDNFQFFSLDNTLFIKDLDKLEKFFGFHQIIKREAKSSVSIIERANILEDVEVLNESIENIAFARKLTRVSSNSPVLGKIPAQTIVEFTKKHPALAGKLKYNEDGSKIRLGTKVSQELFVKLLNDSFLKSELTNMFYDSLAKDKVEQNLEV